MGNLTQKFDRLNPRCALVFHEMADALFSGTTGQTSASFFRDASVLRGLVQDFNRSLEAVRTRGYGVASTNAEVQLAMAIPAMIRDADVPPDLHGTFATVPLIRRLVFGIAPGLAVGAQIDVYSVTLRSCMMLSHLLEKQSADPACSASQALWRNFRDACLEFSGQP